MLNVNGINCTLDPFGRFQGKSSEKKHQQGEQEVQTDTGPRHTKHICAWLKGYVWPPCSNHAAKPRWVSRKKRFCFFFGCYFNYLFIYLFIYFRLCWVFVSVQGLSLVAASGGHSSSRCAGLSLS